MIWFFQSGTQTFCRTEATPPDVQAQTQLRYWVAEEEVVPAVGGAVRNEVAWSVDDG